MLDSLYNECNKDVAAYVRAHRLSCDEAEDLIQETWLKVNSHMHQLDEESKFKPWIMRIAHNVIRRYYRDNSRRRAREEAVGESLQSHPANGRQVAIAKQRRLTTASVLSSLPAHISLLLRMRYWDGLTYQQVADLTNQPLGTVITRTHRGLRATKKKLRYLGYVALEEV